MGTGKKCFRGTVDYLYKGNLNKPVVVKLALQVALFFCLVRLHMVRLLLLERLLQHLSQLHNVGGVQAIPYMQVILMLTSDLDGEDEKDKGALDDLLAQLIAELGMHKKVTPASFQLVSYSGLKCCQCSGFLFINFFIPRMCPRKMNVAP